MTDAIVSLPRNVRRILVIKLRHLGDVLLTTPVYRSLKMAFPHATITACVNEGTEPMLENNPDVQRCLIVPKKLAGDPFFRRLRGQIRCASEVRGSGFDLVLDLTGSDRAAILTRLSGATRRWGVARSKGFLGKKYCYTRTVKTPRGLHIVEQQAAFLKTLEIESEHPILFFSVSDADRHSVREMVGTNRNIVHVHPVSRLMKKCWPVRFMATLLNDLGRRGFQPIITASTDPVEREAIKELISLLCVPHLDLSGKLTLHQLGGLSEISACFIGVDSAPMHIAAAVGVPVIGIFGPSSERLWSPWCDKKLILARDLPCRLPCKNKRACPHIECLRAMTPEMIMPQLDHFLSTIL